MTVDPDRCCLFAQCVATAPEVFWIENEALAWDPLPPPELMGSVEAAVAGCPAQAISLANT